MVVTFDNPTNVNGLVVVAFKSTAGATASIDVSTYMNEIFQVHVNPIGGATFTLAPLSGGAPTPINIPIFTEWAGTTVTLKVTNQDTGVVSATIGASTSGIVIGRK